MKGTKKDSENHIWSSIITDSVHPTRTLLKIMVGIILLGLFLYFMCSFKLDSRYSLCNKENYYLNKPKISTPNHKDNYVIFSPPFRAEKNKSTQTGLHHIVFGIAGSAKLWEQRKNYIKQWWKPNEMRGFVWLDKPVKTRPSERLPPVKISSDTSSFLYSNPVGDRSAIRISRIVSEAFKLGLKDVRWFVMGDDDTFFVAENLVRVLSKYDHNQFYYIGSVSETHAQNIAFSYGMAYGGGGFAISYPLAKALVEMQDSCIQRYPELYGSDDRMHACMAELGVPLTKEAGFHQFDVYGSPYGLLASHPVAPLVTMHHLDVIEPIFPTVATQVEAIERLTEPMKLDSAALMQQSICYEKEMNWTVSVSWGYAVQIQKGIVTPKDLERPLATFLNWYKKTDDTGFSFNTRPINPNPCNNPLLYYIEKVRYDSSTNKTVSEYDLHEVSQRFCRWKRWGVNVDKVKVYKRPDPHMWDKSPRRNCCRILPSSGKSRNMLIDVGPCSEGEYSRI